MPQLINWNINDPNVPVISTETIPAITDLSPPVGIVGFTGCPGSQKENQAAGICVSMNHTLSLVRASGVSLDRWSRTPILHVVPRAGTMLNAFYDGVSLKFFYGTNPRTGKIVYTCESADVVCHELGHAILDSWRPDMWHTASLEMLAFHESFGDMCSVLTAFSYDVMIDHVLNQTGGDLRNINAASTVAEEFGFAIGQDAGLRNAICPFKYVRPETLPYNMPSSALGGEPHNFSRVFTGAFYDLIIFQHEKNRQSMPPHEALAKARDEIAAVLFEGVRNAATQPQFYSSVARAMLLADANRGGACSEGIRLAFGARGILQAMSADVCFSMSGEAKSFYHHDGVAVRTGGVRTVKLVENMEVSSDNPLYSVDVEVPNEQYVELSMDGSPQGGRIVDNNDVMESVKVCLDFLHNSDRVGPEKEFSVVNGKLVRNYIRCCK